MLLNLYAQRMIQRRSRIGGCVIVGIKKDSLNLSVNKIRDLA